MDFNGTYIVIRYRVGVVLISRQGGVDHYAYNLEFKNTNNIVEFEVPFLGIAVAIGKWFRILQALGDTKVIVRKVWN